MSALPKLSLDVRACIADTCYMTNEEAGAHFRLAIFACQSPRLGVPDDDDRLAAMLGVTPKRWAKLKPIVMGFWYASDGLWTHRCLGSPRSRKGRKPQSPRRAAKPRSIMAPANANHPRPKVVRPAPGIAAPTGDR